MAFDDPFRKRTFTVLGLLRWLWRLAFRLPAMFAVYVWPKIPRPDFREKIMLAVTEANDCRYCKYIHEGWAEAAGVDLFNPGEGSEAEQAAFDFGREAAEKGSLEEAANTMTLLENFYNSMEISRIEAVVAAIMIGNLAGNTVEAFLERLKGNRPWNFGAAVNEGAVSFLALPFLLFASLAARLFRVIYVNRQRRHSGIQ